MVTHKWISTPCISYRLTVYMCNIWKKRECASSFCNIPVQSWWRHQMETLPRYWPFVRRIHRSPVNSPHKGQWRGALMFSVICVWVNGWVNNREAGDFRRYRAHFDVIVMELAEVVVIILRGTQRPTHLYSQYRGCRWRGKARSQVISSHDIDQIYQGWSRSHTQELFRVCAQPMRDDVTM